MFIGRDKELNALDKLYKSDKFEFVVIYGRRRVGKTALINQFIGDKKSIYYMGVESNEKQNLENLSKSIIEFSSGILNILAARNRESGNLEIGVPVLGNRLFCA